MRSKIVEARAVPRDARPLKLIIGYFDPLYSEHVRAIRDASSDTEQVVVAVDNPADPVLPWRARAELVAALGCVDWVIDAASAGALAGADVADYREADAGRTASLARHIADRQKLA